MPSNKVYSRPKGDNKKHRETPARQDYSKVDEMKRDLHQTAWKYVPFYQDIWISREGDRMFSRGPVGVWKP